MMNNINNWHNHQSESMMEEVTLTMEAEKVEGINKLL